MKYLIIFLYTAFIAVFGFFYQGKEGLHAMDDRILEKQMDNYYDVDMPRYEDVKEYPILGEQYVNNARIQSSYFVTEDSPITVADFYIKYWESKGLKVSSDINSYGANVSVYDYDEGVIKTVQIKPESGNLFRVILSALNAVNMKREFNSFSDLPVFNNSYGFISYELEDPHYQSSVVSYTNDASLKKNITFYKQEFNARAWKEKESKSEKGITLIVFQKGIKEANLTLTPVKNGTYVSVIVKSRR